MRLGWDVLIPDSLLPQVPVNIPDSPTSRLLPQVPVNIPDSIPINIPDSQKMPTLL